MGYIRYVVVLKRPIGDPLTEIPISAKKKKRKKKSVSVFFALFSPRAKG